MEECPVCLRAYDGWDVVRHCAEPCGHAFCKECALMMVRFGHVLCPMCREPVDEWHAAENARRLVIRTLYALAKCGLAFGVAVVRPTLGGFMSAFFGNVLLTAVEHTMLL